jgi:hypothetical protein
MKAATWDRGILSDACSAAMGSPAGCQERRLLTGESKADQMLVASDTVVAPS